MCGIIASINKEVYSILINGLMQLQNRGYDSAGITVIQNETFNTIKKASSNEENAIDYLKNTKIKGNVGIGHTRWATHGAKTDKNSHPHISNCRKFSLVHNGIIENYQNLKDFLINEGYDMYSETDTEVIVNLISYYYKSNNIIDSIKECVNKLEGTWGLAILCVDNPNTLYTTRFGSPLLVGYDDNTAIITSEKSGFCNLINNYFVLSNHDICVIKKGSKIDVKTDCPYKIKRIEKSFTELTPDPYEHWMLKEIFDQKNSSIRAIKLGSRLLNNDSVFIGGLNEKKNELENVDNLILLGCGTSYNAGCYVINIFKDLCKFNSVQIIDGADFKFLDVPKKGKTCLILLSQSGETKDLHRCINIAKQYELFTIGVVNVVDSLIAREVDCGCYLHAGREFAVASTKSFTSQVIVLILISLWFSQTYYPHENIIKRKQIISDLRNLQNDIVKTFDIRDKIKNLIPLFENKKSCFVLGKGFGEAIAKEGSLKIKEISYVHAEGYSTSSLKHGPFALLEKDFPVILLSPNDEYISKTNNAYQEIKSRYAKVIRITDYECDDENSIQVPYNKTFSHLLMIIPLQFLSYELAISRNLNPDMPRNLAKVVTVE